MRILIVGDSKIMRRTLETVVSSWGYEVICATTGEEAWERVQEDSPGLVITDWMLPNMDGPTLCRHIRKAGQQQFYVYIILLTAREDTQSLVEGLQAGADDFVRKPINFQELRARVAAGERIVKLEQALRTQNLHLRQLSEQLRSAHAQIQRDLVLAGEIQRALIPQRDMMVQGIRFERMFCPSTHVSGDALNYFRLDEYHIGFYIIDVAGHGVAPAMMSVLLSRLLSPIMSQGFLLKRTICEAPYYELVLPPSEVVRELNHQFQNDADNLPYFTMIYGVIDTDTRTLQFCQAGHPSPLYMARGASPQLLGEGGFPVGLLPVADYDSMTLSYGSGDRLFLYSDGITECANSEGEMFGPVRLQRFLAKTRDLPLGEVLRRLRKHMCEWHGGDLFEDDISVLAIEMA